MFEEFKTELLAVDAEGAAITGACSACWAAVVAAAPVPPVAAGVPVVPAVVPVVPVVVPVVCAEAAPANKAATAAVHRVRCKFRIAWLRERNSDTSVSID